MPSCWKTKTTESPDRTGAVADLPAMPAGRPRRHRRFRASRAAGEPVVRVVAACTLRDVHVHAAGCLRVPRTRREVPVRSPRGARDVPSGTASATRQAHRHLCVIPADARKSLRSFRANGLVRRQIAPPIVGTRRLPKRSPSGDTSPSPVMQRGVRWRDAIVRINHEMPFFMCFVKRHCATEAQPAHRRRASSKAIASGNDIRPGGAPGKNFRRIVDMAKNRD